MITPTFKHLLWTTCCCTLLFFTNYSWADPLHSPPATEGKSLFDSFYQEEILEISLETDLTALLADKKSDTYYTALLKIESAEGMESTYPVNVRMRGHYRRRVCDFPPLKLKFPEESLEAEGFNPRYRSLKLVTHCLDDKREGKENVLREYLAYKMFNELSANSFRVQLVKIKYIDRTESSRSEERYGFIIEDPDQVADRMDGSECEQDCMNPDPSTLDAKETTLVALYQYMIGNSDWNIQMMRNLKLVTYGDDRGNMIVPYDFDFAGLINADYAVPSGDHKLAHIRERVYLGPEVDDAVMTWAINYLKFKRKDLLKTVRGFKPLSLQARNDATAYLESFFDYVGRLNVNQATGIHANFVKEKLGYPLPSVGL